eukprot:3137608-Rhodomonas_salina.1
MAVPRRSDMLDMAVPGRSDMLTLHMPLPSRSSECMLEAKLAPVVGRALGVTGTTDAMCMWNIALPSPSAPSLFPRVGQAISRSASGSARPLSLSCPPSSTSVAFTAPHADSACRKSCSPPPS